ncbi:GNAT family N-acetyltransferase [Oricola cellulosilytica]|uniref:GNAT family N-acetyltransferase n=1 Tax=Oricola cellulosilytica TaxID=1429082 RepID=A0A4R0PEI9_9HYPH|nr:GNAT family N-acetyltransferase [Oricola cellulosilytica]TCD15183.1 GNAT family N-acetyltransferase [Oricola cellulosilytica]
METPIDDADFLAAFLCVDNSVCCHTAVAGPESVPVGFQSLSTHPRLPSEWLDIATYARPKRKLRGIGRALFGPTLEFACQRGIIAINATIRADNRSGLSYYEKMGFRDWAIERAMPLADGTPVDRISRMYDLRM